MGAWPIRFYPFLWKEPYEPSLSTVAVFRQGPNYRYPPGNDHIAHLWKRINHLPNHLFLRGCLLFSRGVTLYSLEICWGQFDARKMDGLILDDRMTDYWYWDSDLEQMMVYFLLNAELKNPRTPQIIGYSTWWMKIMNGWMHAKNGWISRLMGLWGRTSSHLEGLVKKSNSPNYRRFPGPFNQTPLLTKTERKGIFVGRETLATRLDESTGICCVLRFVPHYTVP